MTVIVAKFNKQRTKIVIGSDSQTTCGKAKYTNEETSEISSKLLKVDKEYVIASSGLCQETGLFQRYCKRTKPKDATEDAIFDFMNDFHSWVLERNSSFKFDSNYLIIFKGRIFSALNGWEVVEHKDFAASGSGYQCANVAFNMGASVKEAVGMAIRHNLYCGGDIQTIDINV